MTADRTPIRRGLGIRRGADGPPWRGRKLGHRSILAPLAATLAATVAVSVGVALARVERERRDERRRRRETRRRRRLGLTSGERLADAMQRMALGQVDLTLELLTGAGAGGDAKTVHETRKALKRLRALLGLVRHELGAKAYARQADALRDTAQRLSGARDAEVMLGTLDGLVARHQRTLGRSRGVRRLRERLLEESERMQQRTLGNPSERTAMLAELRGLREQLQAWTLPDRDGVELVDADLARLYRQGRKRYRRVLRGKGEQTLAMHAWRKRVKDLRYAAEMLTRRGGDERLSQLSRRADRLGEILGEDHDLAVFAERLRAGGRWDGQATWRTGRKTRKRLLKRIAKRRAQLRKQALREGKRLYSQPPKQFMRRFRASYATAARAARRS